MIGRESIPTDLALAIEGEVTPDEFVTAVRRFFGYVREIAKAQSGEEGQIGWRVEVRSGSAVVGLEATGAAAEPRLAAIYRQARHGAEALSRGDLQESGLPAKAIEHLTRLSELSAGRTSGAVGLWVQREPLPIGPETHRRLREDPASGYCDSGTLEGRLEAIRDRHGSLQIQIRDLLFPKAIPCDVPDSLIATVLSCFRRRVEIEGRIHYRRDGTPIRIEALALEALPDDEELPGAADVRGILASA